MRVTMTISMKQKFQAVLYYMLVILAVYITGCRNTPGVGETEDPTVTPTTTNTDNNTTGTSTAKPIPSIQTAVVNMGAVNINHEWSEGDEDKIVSIDCQSKEQSASVWQTYAIGAVDSNSCSNASPAAGRQVYRLHVTYTDGSDFDSNETPPLLAVLPVPDSFLVTDIGSQNHLAWMYDNSYTAAELTGYEIQYQAISGVTYYPSATTYYTYNVINPAILYYNVDPCSFQQYAQFRVRAKAGSNLAHSAWTPFSYQACP